MHLLRFDNFSNHNYSKRIQSLYSFLTLSCHITWGGGGISQIYSEARTSSIIQNFIVYNIIPYYTQTFQD